MSLHPAALAALLACDLGLCGWTGPATCGAPAASRYLLPARVPQLLRERNGQLGIGMQIPVRRWGYVMKLLSWAMGLLLFAAPASAATTLYSRDVPAGDMAALTINYDGPASGFQQTFQLTYTGLTMDIDALNRLEYQQDNILYAGSNDSTGVYASCVILRDGDSTCARELGASSPFPPVTFVQTATGGQVTFTITNPNRVYLTGCPGLGSYCYTEHGYSEGHGTIRGMFAPGDGGHYEFIAFDPIAVPEPTTWALMIVGFGVAGLGLRTRYAGVLSTRADPI